MNAPTSTRFPDVSDNALTSGTTLQNGAFVIRDVLGHGGFGITYRAHDVQKSREVALKELFTTICRRDENHVQVEENHRAVFDAAKVRFLEQARVLTQLRHTNIVRVLGFFEENNTAYLVMEVLSGQTLLDMVQERGALDEDEALRLIEPLGGALEAIHRLGLLHLDIKPENVVVTENHRVVLMDFDLIQKLHDGEELDTRPLDMPSHCGTPGYAPIEQYSVATHFSPASDIYALGATLHHLITGKAPLSALERAHDDALHLPDSCSENVRQTIEKSLQIRVEDRPQNVRAFRKLIVPPQIVASPVAVKSNAVLQNGSAVQNASMPVASVANTSTNAASSTRTQTQNPAQNAARNPNLVWRVAVDNASAKTLQWPQVCPCCGAKTNDWYEIGRVARTWRVPHCDSCVQHIDTARTAIFVGAWGMLGGLIIAALGLFIGSLILGPLGLLIHITAMCYGMLQSFSAETMKTPKCCDKKVALRVHEANSQRVVFEFLRREYADEFRQLNGARWG